MIEEWETLENIYLPNNTVTENENIGAGIKDD